MVSEQEAAISAQNQTQIPNSTVHAMNTMNTMQADLPNQFNHPLNLKLDNSNYLIWRQQVLAVIRGHRLMEFLTDSFSRFLDEEEMLTIGFTTWQKQDQLLVWWLLSSINVEILGHLVDCTTAHEVWIALEKIFMARSQANIIQLMFDLQSLRKEGLTMTNYLVKKKNIIDSLIAGLVVSEKEQVMHILVGLAYDYDAVVTVATSRVEPFSVREVSSLLLTHEARIERNNNANLTQAVSVNTANMKRGSYNSNRGRGGRFMRGRYQGGRGRNQSRPQCQIYYRIGYTATQCYYRFDQSFVSNNQASGGSSVQGNNSHQSVAYTVQNPSQNFSNNNQNFVNNNQNSLNNSNSQLSAYVASPETLVDLAWYTDSGANHHCTPFAENILTKTDYGAKGKVVIGNGSGNEENTAAGRT